MFNNSENVVHSQILSESAFEIPNEKDKEFKDEEIVDSIVFDSNND